MDATAREASAAHLLLKSHSHGRDGEVEPVSAVYPVRLGVTAPSAPPAQVIRGWVHVEAEPRSFIGCAYDVIASVLIRESGF